MNTITMSYSDLIEMRAYQKGIKESEQKVREAEEKALLKIKEAEEKAFLKAKEAEEKAFLKAKEAEEKAYHDKVNLVKNMIKLNMTDETILQCIELTVEEITDIRNGN